MTSSIGRRVLALALVLSFGLGGAAAVAKARVEPLQVVGAQGKTANFQVEFVDTPKSRERGLMHRKSLAPNAGMLFDFKTERPVAFWMKNTFIPLDLIYIRADGRILSITRNARPHDLSPLPSGGPVRAVLEIPGGRAAQLDIWPGDRVRHRIFPTR